LTIALFAKRDRQPFPSTEFSDKKECEKFLIFRGRKQDNGMNLKEDDEKKP